MLCVLGAYGDFRVQEVLVLKDTFKYSWKFFVYLNTAGFLHCFSFKIESAGPFTKSSTNILIVKFLPKNTSDEPSLMSQVFKPYNPRIRMPLAQILSLFML